MKKSKKVLNNQNKKQLIQLIIIIRDKKRNKKKTRKYEIVKYQELMIINNLQIMKMIKLFVLVQFLQETHFFLLQTQKNMNAFMDAKIIIIKNNKILRFKAKENKYI